MKRTFFLLCFLVASCMLHAQTLAKTYGNKYFNLKYPNTWEIVAEDYKAPLDVTLSVMIRAKQINDIDFMPNINIIKSGKKRIESTSDLANTTFRQLYSVYPSITSKKIQNIELCGCKGTLLEYEWNLQGYSLHCYQYFIKKADNTTFTISCCIDNNRLQSQKKIIDAIMASLKIK